MKITKNTKVVFKQHKKLPVMVVIVRNSALAISIKEKTIQLAASTNEKYLNQLKKEGFADATSEEFHTFLKKHHKVIIKHNGLIWNFGNAIENGVI